MKGWCLACGRLLTLRKKGKFYPHINPKTGQRCTQTNTRPKPGSVI